ncbi:MAG: hypothetical protein IJ662_06420 [Clostridia bacterium]|nr:hypothetical protein [Clostridia bacterium]
MQDLKSVVHQPKTSHGIRGQKRLARKIVKRLGFEQSFEQGPKPRDDLIEFMGERGSLSAIRRRKNAPAEGRGGDVAFEADGRTSGRIFPLPGFADVELIPEGNLKTYKDPEERKRTAPSARMLDRVEGAV